MFLLRQIPKIWPFWGVRNILALSILLIKYRAREITFSQATLTETLKTIRHLILSVVSG